MSYNDNLEKIKNARYGREVRQAIHDNLEDVYDISINGRETTRQYKEDVEALAKSVSGSVGIDDEHTGSATTWSSNKIKEYANAYTDNVIGESLSFDSVDGKLSVNKIVGKTYKSKNLFDKNNVDVINAYINAKSLLSASFTRTIRIPCKPNTIYTISKVISSRFGVGYASELISSGTLTNSIEDASRDSITITTDANAKYLYVYAYHSNADTIPYQTIIDSIMVNEGTTALPYEPYGIFSSGETKVDGHYALVIEEHNEDNTETNEIIIPLEEPLYEQNVISKNGIIKNYASVDLGSLSWASYNGTFYATLDGYAHNTKLNIVCSKYDSDGNVNGGSDLYNRGNNKIALYYPADYNRVYIRDDSYTDATAFKNAMQGVMLVYELATPSTTPLTDEQKEAINSLVTFDGMTYVDTSDKYAKATLDVDYAIRKSVVEIENANAEIIRLNGIVIEQAEEINKLKENQEFQDGEEWTIGGNGLPVFGGYVSSTSTSLAVTIPLPKSAKGMNVELANDDGVGTFRYYGGYVYTPDGVSTYNVPLTKLKSVGTPYFNISADGKYLNMGFMANEGTTWRGASTTTNPLVNNTCVTGGFNGVTLKFTKPFNFGDANINTAPDMG